MLKYLQVLVHGPGGVLSIIDTFYSSCSNTSNVATPKHTRFTCCHCLGVDVWMSPLVHTDRRQGFGNCTWRKCFLSENSSKMNSQNVFWNFRPKKAYDNFIGGDISDRPHYIKFVLYFLFFLLSFEWMNSNLSRVRKKLLMHREFPMQEILRKWVLYLFHYGRSSSTCHFYGHFDCNK